MGEVTHIHTAQVIKMLQKLLKMAQEGRITFIEGMVQVETGDEVEWSIIREGEKSYDPLNLINQLGQIEIIKQSILEEICAEVIDAD